MDGWTNGWMDGQTDKGTDGWTDGQTDRPTNKHTDTLTKMWLEKSRNTQLKQNDTFFHSFSLYSLLSMAHYIAKF